MTAHSAPAVAEAPDLQFMMAALLSMKLTTLVVHSFTTVMSPGNEIFSSDFLASTLFFKNIFSKIFEKFASPRAKIDI